MRYFLALLTLFPTVLSAMASSVADHKIHEAFFSKDQNHFILQAVPLKPPTDIVERIPKSNIKGAVWIPGYWSWSTKFDRYVWVTGTWRVPPPGHEWIAGTWKNYDEGWVWLSGFWSPHKLAQLKAYDRPPPDRVDENTGLQPGENYFWLPGHWVYNEDVEDFIWFTGRWQEFDPNWQYVPARYVWRERGYIFIDGFWDWPLEKRGEAFKAVEIPHDEIDTIAFAPKERIEVPEICRLYYADWPDYYMAYHYWYFYNPQFDFGFGPVPDWWGWSSWWAFNGVDLWWLWWWWTHPGYPHPFFMTMELASQIVPPNDGIVHFMELITPLAFIAPSGVIDIQDLVTAIENFTGHTDPILPPSPEEVFEIQEEARPSKRPMRVLQPTAQQAPTSGPMKPFFGPKKGDFSQPPQPTKEPSYPSSKKIQHPTIQQVESSKPVTLPKKQYDEDLEEEVQEATPNRYMPRRQPTNNTRMRSPYPESYKPQEYAPRPRYAPPSAGYKPRTTPDGYQSQEPTKPRYQPRSRTEPAPAYTPPSKLPENSRRYYNPPSTNQSTYNQLK